MERRCPLQRNAGAEADRLMLFGEEIMAPAVAAEAARLLGPLRPCPFQEICSGSGPGGGRAAPPPLGRLAASAGPGAGGGCGGIVPHNPLDPTLVEEARCLLGCGWAWLSLGVFRRSSHSGPEKDSPFL